MARPKKMGMDYFPHDTDALSDEKIEALRSMFGNDGYAFYFILLERIYRTPDFELDLSSPGIITILARKVGVSPDKFLEILDFALDFGCFDKKLYKEKKLLTSSGIKKRAGVVVEKRRKMQERYKSKELDALEVSEAENSEETAQSKENESTVKETKEYKTKDEESKKDDEDPIVSIIDYFSDKSGVLIPDGKDIALAKTLSADIPVNIIKKGIDEAFRRYKPKREGESIRTLRYCEGCIKDVWDAEKAAIKATGGVIVGHDRDNLSKNNGYEKRDWTGFLYSDGETRLSRLQGPWANIEKA